MLLRHATSEGVANTRTLVAHASDALAIAEEVRALLLVAPAPAVSAPELTVEATRPPAVLDPPSLPRERPGRVMPIEGTWAEVSVGGALLLGSSRPGAGATAHAAIFPVALRAGRVDAGAGAVGFVSLLPERIEREGGATDQRTLGAGIEAIARVRRLGPIDADIALGAAVVHARFTGDARPPRISRDVSLSTVCPTLRARASYGPRSARVYVEGLGGSALRDVTVRFAGKDVATWGRPWLTVSAGVALRF